jgi:hypothetical protein
VAHADHVVGSQSVMVGCRNSFMYEVNLERRILDMVDNRDIPSLLLLTILLPFLADFTCYKK